MITNERPLLATIDQHVEGDRARVTVTLGLGDEVYSGTAEGSVDPQQRSRLVGEATLRALEQVFDGELHLDLSAVGSTDLGPVRIALAQVKEASWSDYLIGSSLVREGDAATATAKAVLDALNRRIASEALSEVE